MDDNELNVINTNDISLIYFPSKYFVSVITEILISLRESNGNQINFVFTKYRKIIFTL